MKKWQIAIIVVILLAAVAGGGVYKYASSLKEEIANYVLPNVTFEGIALEGKTKDEVVEMIDQVIAEYNAKTVEVEVNGETETYTWEELGAQYAGTDVADIIFEEQQGTITELREMKKAAEDGTRTREYSITVSVDEGVIAEAITDKYNENLTDPTDATVSIKAGTTDVKVTESKDGSKVDKDALAKLLAEAVLNDTSTVEAPIVAVSPTLSTEEAKNLTFEVVSEYRTSVKERDENPLHNITLAASKMDGAFLAPEGIYSHKDRVGYIDAANGYKEATVFVSGKVSTDIGGGVCQVSTTLYNAVLLADIDNIYRAAHSRTVSYVPYGLDAVVANYGADFRFANETESYLYIQSWVEGDELIVRLLGVPTGREVELITETVSKTASQLVVNSYKTVTKNGEVITDRQQIATSTYKID